MKIKAKKPSELDAFVSLTDKLLSVSHAEIKIKLDQEKQAKKKKKNSAKGQ